MKKRPTNGDEYPDLVGYVGSQKQCKAGEIIQTDGGTNYRVLGPGAFDGKLYHIPVAEIDEIDEEWETLELQGGGDTLENLIVPKQRKDQPVANTRPTEEELAEIRAMKQQKSQQRIHKISGILDGVDPWVLVGTGCLMLAVWAICTVTQIRTSEALMLHGGKVPVNVEWGVFLQPIQLISGTAPIENVMPWCYAWGIEALTLTWAFALEHAKIELLRTNKLLGSIYGTVTVLLIGLNGWADYDSSPGNDPLQQALIAGVVGLLVTTGLPVGLVLLKTGLAKMNRSI